MVRSIKDYNEHISLINFSEFPAINVGNEFLNSFLDYDVIDSDLKLHLCKVILCRSFYGTYIAWIDDVNWFLNNFLKELNDDLIKPQLTMAIKEAGEMILSEDIFSKRIIGTSFLFGVIEFYAKHELGYRPSNFNFFDKSKKNYIKRYNPKLADFSIKSSFENLQKLKFPISAALNEIDSFTIKKLTTAGVEDRNWIRYRIADRLSLARNPMLHGEQHSFDDIGHYLLMLYCLFHFVRQQLDNNTKE